MPLSLIDAAEASVPLLPIRTDAFENWLEGQPAQMKAWLTETGFTAKDGQTALLSGEDGKLAKVLVGIGAEI